MDLDLPDQLTVVQRKLIIEIAERNNTEHGDGLLGLVLSGSAARGMATDRSDLDMYVVLANDIARLRSASRSAAVDELPVALSEDQRIDSLAKNSAGQIVVLDMLDSTVREAGRSSNNALGLYDGDMAVAYS